MKLLKKVLSVMMMCAAIVSLSSCSDLKVTEQMQAGIDAYIAAVAKSEKRESGSVKVVSLSKDNAIEFKNTESVIECDFTVTDGKVSYTRSDYLNGEKPPNINATEISFCTEIMTVKHGQTERRRIHRFCQRRQIR